MGTWGIQFDGLQSTHLILSYVWGRKLYGCIQFCKRDWGCHIEVCWWNKWEHFAGSIEKCFIRSIWYFLHRNILLGKLNAKRQRRQERRAKEVQPGGTLPWRNQNSLSPFTVTSGSSSNLLNGASTTVGVNRSSSSSSMYKTKKKRNDQDLKRKLTKDDISLPSNFRYWIQRGVFYI